jgi:hypothetical protein
VYICNGNVDPEPLQMTSPGQRGISLQMFKFDAHIDWSTFPMQSISLDFAKKGELDRSGRKNWKNNNVELRYVGDLPDRYDERIGLLFDAIGGVPIVTELIRLHKPENAFVLLEIPAKTSPLIEEGYISVGNLQLLSGLGIDLQFWYT